jgi:hypothetical protein
MSSSHASVNKHLYETTMGADDQCQPAQKRVKSNCLEQVCGCRYRPSSENLEYDYTKGENQPLPRIRQRGEFYVDKFNSESWSCSFGTNEEVSLVVLLNHRSCDMRRCHHMCKNTKSCTDGLQNDD